MSLPLFLRALGGDDDARFADEPRVLTPSPTMKGLPAAELDSHATDHAIVARIRLGDAAAFEVLFRTYHARLVGFAHGYLRDADSARDVVADVMLQLWRGRAAWSPEGGIPRYLYGAVRNRAHSYARSARRAERGHSAAADHFTVTEQGAPAMGAAPPNTETVMDADECVALVWRTVATLPERAREIIVLRWREQLDFETIAAILGITKAAAHMQLSRAMAMLRRALPEWMAQ